MIGALLVVALLGAEPARRPVTVSAFTGVPFGHYYSCEYLGSCAFPLMFSARVNLPLTPTPTGGPPGVTSSFELELGLDVRLVLDRPVTAGLVPLIEPRWTLQLLPELSAYLKLSVGVGWYPGHEIAALRPDYDLLIGASYQLNKTLALRLELGARSIKLGVAL